MSKYDFYIPRTKEDLVDWLGLYYPVNKAGEVINWKKDNVRTLRAVYITVRKRMDSKNGTRPTKKELESRPTQMQYEFFKRPGERANS